MLMLTIKVIAGLCWMLILTVLPLYAASNSAPISHDKVIYKNGDVYAAFPNLFKAEDGTLVVSFNVRQNKSHYESSTGKLFVSKDKGLTWEESKKIYLNPAYKSKSGDYIIPYANGWKEIDATQATKYKSKEVLVRNSGNKYFIAIGAHLRISSDNGKSWKRQTLDIPPLAVLMNHNASAYLRTSKNVRLFSVYGKTKKDDLDTPFLMRSNDDGKTWQFSKMFADMPKNIGFNEAALVETSQGKIIALLRPDPDSNGYLYSSVSIDRGTTWSLPHKTSIWGYPANTIRLKDGRIFCSYGYRKDPMGIRGGILNNEYTGLIGNEIIIRDDAKVHPAHVGYPMAVEVSDSKVVVVYYITNQDGITHIAGSVIVP